MKQEDKELLLQDLCARLPYGVKVQTTYINQKSKERSDIGIDILTTVELSMLIDGFEEHKPYLFPLSSMTEEQKKELHNIQGVLTVDFELEEYKMVHLFQSQNVIDWFNKNHFDYRGLIEKGLAINAAGLNIY